MLAPPSERNVLSRSGPAVVVIGVHALMAYALLVTMGVTDAPQIAEPLQTIFIPESQDIESEPEPIVKPDLTDIVEPTQTPVPELQIEEPLAPPADTAMPASDNAIAASSTGAAPQELKTTSRIEPVYPPGARRAGEEGMVRLKVLVDERGRPSDVQIAKSSGFPRLDQAAMEAVRRWKFAAATNAQGAVSTWTQVAITFKLTDTEKK